MLISAPDDYGLTAAETLAHAWEGAAPDVDADDDSPAPPAPPARTPEGFDAFWAHFADEVESLPRRWIGNVSDEVNEVLVPSIRALRVVARVTRPDAKPRGIVVVVHADEPPTWPEPGAEPWTRRGLATVRLRVRGLAPSTADIGDLVSGDAWILHHIDAADAWIVRGAVADVIQTVRCARRDLGAGLPLGLYGASLGGGLAVIAAARLAATDEAPHRLVLSHPDLGDWSWRCGRYCAGPGGRINERLVALRNDRALLERTLGLFDAARHAGAVACPVLTRLAERDDVVPAPSAAAVHNALAAETAYRFVTAYGHFDGGVADGRRHDAFDAGHPAFLDPAVSPADAVAGLEAFSTM